MTCGLFTRKWIQDALPGGKVGRSVKPLNLLQGSTISMSLIILLCYKEKYLILFAVNYMSCPKLVAADAIMV